MPFIKTYIYSLLICFFTCINFSYSQENPEIGVSQIEHWIKIDSLVKAQDLLDTKLLNFRNKKNYDSLVNYIELVGSYVLSNGNKEKAYKKAEEFVEEIKLSKDPIIIALALQTLGYLHGGYGKAEDTYVIYEESYRIAKASPSPKKAKLANIKYKLGYTAQNIGDFQLAKKHYLEAANILDNWKSSDVEFYQQIYNAMGGMMWMESKLDSSSYYFNKSLIALKKADTTDLMNAFFRPALIKMNLSVLKNALGDNDQAILLSQESIEEFGIYIQKSKDEFRIISAKKHRATTIENLGSFYHSIGEFKKADVLITYANSEKKKFLDSNSSGMLISRIILAQAKIGVRDFTSAKKLLEEALMIMDENPGTENYWKSGALTTLGTVYENLGDNKKADIYYSKGNNAYKKTLKGVYNKDYFDELIDISNFYATSGYPEKGLTIAKEIYDEAKKSDFKNTLQYFQHTVNLAKIYYEIEDYENAIFYAEEALSFRLNGTKEESNNMAIEYRKPKALYVLIASKYALNKNLSTQQIINFLDQVEEGFKSLEIRKATLKNYEDVSLFIEENTQFFELAKKLRLDLYQRTQNESYLDDVIALHESAMYSRIRSRLNLRNNTLSAKIPKKIFEREQLLKSNLNEGLKTDNSIDTFFEANKAWTSFIDSLKINFPKYYKLQYATLEESVIDIQDNLDTETTLVRFIFIEENLYALVISKNKKELFPIDFNAVKELINNKSLHEFDVEKVAPKLHQLYTTLWQPFEEYVSTKNVIIIPDRELFNLSFEMLTPKPLTSFKEITHNSLLAKYNISYQFSLLVIHPKQNIVNSFDSNFVAFAPEFSDAMKEQYQLVVKDSTTLDKAYLNLLPQPFSVDVIKKYTKQFNGDSFLNEKASKQLFQKTAGEHKIIHIGTHAESDNISPELSRLVFAKNSTSENLEDNYLHTYEIYNYDLSSNLAILTACETGKPSYQAGEGMISLAHAFSYAGSESILTSLWEIDEESSSTILNYFYDNLSKTMPKDEALRKAKLDYIISAKGRTVSPQYWAGLVIIGDTTPLQLNATTNWWYWILGVLLILFLFFILKKHKA